MGWRIPWHAGWCLALMWDMTVSLSCTTADSCLKASSREPVGSQQSWRHLIRWPSMPDAHHRVNLSGLRWSLVAQSTEMLFTWASWQAIGTACYIDVYPRVLKLRVHSENLWQHYPILMHNLSTLLQCIADWTPMHVFSNCFTPDK